ncbi:hypothetical protein [Streptomyces sp. HPF1205]|uniref:hypothetical protein n=1 Tax=Streptomyces sp. HPF1205 TaxID=2873262 RepID=UPI001CEDC4AC|nr:hypothetical protein [Streptomyces sp. HPF1205]
MSAGAALAGCGGHDSAADAPLVRPLSGAVSDEGPFANLTGLQVLERANAAMGAATALTFREDGTRAGHTVHARSVMADGGRCAATMSDDTGKQLRVIGTGSAYYLKGSSQFWKASDLPGSAIKTLDGKWLRLPAAAIRSGGSIAFMCDKDQFVKRMGSQSDVGTITKRRPTTLSGARVMPLLHVKPEVTTTVYVAMSGRPYILAIQGVRQGAAGGRITETFGGFDRIPRISAPPADRTVGPGALGGSKDFTV